MKKPKKKSKHHQSSLPMNKKKKFDKETNDLADAAEKRDAAKKVAKVEKEEAKKEYLSN